MLALSSLGELVANWVLSLRVGRPIGSFSVCF